MSSGKNPLPVSSPRRQSTSAIGLNHKRISSANPSVPATSSILSHSTPPPVRRNSNPTGDLSLGLSSYNPAGSRTQSLELKCRRYSQPSSSPSSYSAIADPLIKQEKASYSSLSFLPEVQTYLHFMEDTNSTGNGHQRSNSFNGQNSLRSGPTKHRTRTRSQSRSPCGREGEEETCFSNPPPPYQDNRGYGQYLTPSRSASMDTQVQHHAPPLTRRKMSLGSSEQSPGAGKRTTSRHTVVALAQNFGGGLSSTQSPPPPTTPVPEDQEKEHESENEDQTEPIFRRCFERRRSSTIRTSFI